MTHVHRILASLGETTAADWDAVVRADDPFNRYHFLKALERGGAVAKERGCAPLYLLAEAQGKLACALPLTLKTHSYGEYIFDWGLADAWERSGRDYYPKLVAMVPFTPATSARWTGQLPLAEGFAALEPALFQLADETGAQSIQLLYLSEAEACVARDSARFALRSGLQFHFESRGWTCFEEHLAAMRSGHRKQVRRERKLAHAQGLTLAVEPGTQLNDEDWQRLYACYHHTCAERGAPTYLPPGVFSHWRAHFSEAIRVATARDDAGRLQAAALAFVGEGALFGRYWGSLCGQEHLHFELCYHAFIEWGLANGIQRFESGAQGEHKIKRGFVPTLTRAAYWFRDPDLHKLAARAFAQEHLGLQAQAEMLKQALPYRA